MERNNKKMKISSRKKRQTARKIIIWKEKYTCAKHNARIASVSAAGDGSDDHGTMSQFVVFAFELKDSLCFCLIPVQSVAFKANL